MTEFQSTHPVWGETKMVYEVQDTQRNFNPPTPCGVGHRHVSQFFVQIRPFQSTHPVWGGTATVRPFKTEKTISIHPPRVGWDRRREHGNDRIWNFNPPTPCGVGRIRLD